jgi:hypothetical protein
MKIEGLRFEGETTWDNVWQAWLEREGIREDWQQVAKEKGWQSWEEWRNAWVSNFGAQTRQWLRYTILNPLEMVPKFRVGPTQSWQKNFPEIEYNKHTFTTLIERVSYDTNRKVQGILKNFPDPTEFIGIVMPDKKIVDIEGHHRATALAIVANQHRKIAFEHLPTIALTPFEESEEALLDTMLARGSAKERSK